MNLWPLLREWDRQTEGVGEARTWKWGRREPGLHHIGKLLSIQHRNSEPLVESCERSNHGNSAVTARSLRVSAESVLPDLPAPHHKWIFWETAGTNKKCHVKRWDLPKMSHEFWGIWRWVFAKHFSHFALVTVGLGGRKSLYYFSILVHKYAFK